MSDNSPTFSGSWTFHGALRHLKVYLKVYFAQHNIFWPTYKAYEFVISHFKSGNSKKCKTEFMLRFVH